MAVPDVDFYMFPDQNERNLSACWLLQKICSPAQTFFVNVENSHAAEKFDELLWTFHDISFLPHCLAGDADADAAPVVIGDWERETATRAQTFSAVLNLAEEIPDALEGMRRVAEVVPGDEHEKEMARRRYKAYRERGCALKHHELAAPPRR